MTNLEILDALRNDFQSGKISFASFAEQYNETLGRVVATTSDADKIAAFDRIAKNFNQGLEAKDEYDKGKLYADSDDRHYLFEEVAQAIYGNNFFNLYNKLYEG